MNYSIISVFLLLITHKCVCRAAGADASSGSSWLGSWFGLEKPKDEQKALSTTSVEESVDNVEVKLPGTVKNSRRAKGSFLKSRVGRRQYLDVNPYVGDEEVSIYEQKRIERARRLIEQDFADADYDRGGSRQKRPRADIDYDEIEGQRRKGAQRGIGGLPDIALRLDPIVNFKLKQRITYFGTCVTLGMDYLSDLAQWRAYCGIEDTFLQGRFSLKGKELSWAKSWLVNLGMGEESTAKFKLRVGLNLNNYQAYARLRFRTEPISSFDIGEGLTCAGKLPLPGLLPLLRTVPLRVEYRVRVNTPTQKGNNLVPARRTAFGWGKKDGTDSDIVSLSTGIDTVEVSLDELNFCLEWDEKSPVWDIGLVRTGDRLRGVFGTQGKPVSVSPSSRGYDDDVRGYRGRSYFGRNRQSTPPSEAPKGGNDLGRGGTKRSEMPGNTGKGSESGGGVARGAGGDSGQKDGQSWRDSLPPYRHYSAWPSLNGFSDGP